MPTPLRLFDEEMDVLLALATPIARPASFAEMASVCAGMSRRRFAFAAMRLANVAARVKTAELHVVAQMLAGEVPQVGETLDRHVGD